MTLKRSAWSISMNTEHYTVLQDLRLGHDTPNSHKYKLPAPEKLG